MKHAVTGCPNPFHISTSYVERSNLTIRMSRTLRVTPAMAAGVTSRVWEIEDLVALLPTVTGQKRGPYRKGNSN